MAECCRYWRKLAQQRWAVHADLPATHLCTVCMCSGVTNFPPFPHCFPLKFIKVWTAGMTWASLPNIFCRWFISVYLSTSNWTNVMVKSRLNSWCGKISFWLYFEAVYWRGVSPMPLCNPHLCECVGVWCMLSMQQCQLLLLLVTACSDELCDISHHALFVPRFWLRTLHALCVVVWLFMFHVCVSLIVFVLASENWRWGREQCCFPQESSEKLRPLSDFPGMSFFQCPDTFGW